MDLANRVAELTGYAVYFIAVLGICGSTSAWVNELIHRDRADQYPECGWSRDIPHYNSLWEQSQATAGAPPAELVPAPVLELPADAPGAEL
jgi:hypothetical protein